MAKKYYDYLKPRGQQVSFSDTVNQQMMMLEAQQQRQSSAALKAIKDRQKTMTAQERQLLGFDTEGFSDVHKEVFNNKLMHTRGKVNGFYYTGSHQGEFFEDIMSLKELHGNLKRHHSNVQSEKTALEGWVTGTKDWTDKNNELRDDMTTLAMKNDMWNNSGIDVESIQYDPATGDAYAYYTDINGDRLKGENGQDIFGLVSESPTLGSKSFYSPTASPYANLLPGAFSKNFSSSLGRLEGSLEEKTTTLRNWVTEEAKNNPNVVATALNTFKDNYGENVYQSILSNDKNTRGEEEGYLPMDMREYIDETMKFLTGKLEEEPSGDSDRNIFPSSVAFNMENFIVPPEFQLSNQFTANMGEGISALLVPKAGVGTSGLMVESTYKPQSNADPRFGEVDSHYRVLGVAMDETDVHNLFVRAEMYVEEDVSKISPARLARLQANLPAGVEMDMDNKTVKSKVVRNFVVSPLNLDGSRNTEYLSILGQVGYASGATKGSGSEALQAGMQTLLTFNDEQAQLSASASAMNAQNPNDANTQMMLDMQLMNAVEPVLIQRHGNNANNELALLLDYVKEFPDERQTILKAIQDGKIPYVASTGELMFEDAQ